MFTNRSCADTMSYGDEPSAAAVLNPQRFDNKGVPDREFLIRRPKAEVHALVSSFPQLGDVDFETLWAESLALFDDDEPLCSLDAMLFVHSRNVEGEARPDIVRTDMLIALSQSYGWWCMAALSWWSGWSLVGSAELFPSGAP